MPGGVLVIGVGGAGRGVVNHLKWRLETIYGSPENAGVVLYVIDGPTREDANMVPGEYQIEVAAGTDEKYTFQTDPCTVLSSIAQGRTVPYISDWLSREAASRTPREGIHPNDGFGGIRVPGRVTFFSEADSISTQLGRLVTEARTLFANAGVEELPGQPEGGQAACMTVFICGSQSGGTGAGLLLDTALLLRSKLTGNNKARFIGMVVLPNTFHHFNEGDNKTRLVANGMAGFRELMRAQAKEFPFGVAYNNNLSVSAEQLFNICYLVDGGQKYQGKDPRHYVHPAAADLILAHVQDTSRLYALLPNRCSSIEAQPSNKRFSRYGIHEIAYVPRQLAEIFSFRFVQDVYGWVTEPSPSDPFDGRHAAGTFLHGFSRFTAMSTLVGKDPGPPLTPEQNNYSVLGQSFEEAGLTARYPLFPCPDLVERVKVSGAIFNKKTNAIVQRTAESGIDQYLGSPDSTEVRNIHGWLRQRESALVEAFEDALVSKTADLFFNRTADGLVPKNWAEGRGLLANATAFVKSVKEALDTLAEEVDRTYTRCREVTDAKGNTLTIVQQAKAKMDAAFQGKNPNSVDRAAQEMYLRLGSIYLQVSLWDIFMAGAKRILTKMLDSSARLLNRIGPSAEGWLRTLEDSRDAAQDTESGRLSAYAQFEQILTRTYLPTGNGEDITHLYRNEVYEPHLDPYLRSCKWLLGVERDQTSNRNTVDAFCIFAVTPEVPGFHTPHRTTKLRVLHDNSLLDFEGRQFTWQETREYIYRKIEPQLREKSIWDIMALDFLHNYSQRDGIRGLSHEQRVDGYCTYLVNRLIEGGQSLQFGSTGAGAIGLDQCCVSAFRDVPHATDVGDTLATRFLGKLRERNVPVQIEQNRSHQITLLGIDDAIGVASWEFDQEGRRIYYDYCQRPGTPPVSLCPNEQRAVPIEINLARIERTTPPSFLSAELVALLHPYEVFEAVTLAHAFGLLRQERRQWEGVDMPIPVLGVQDAGREHWFAPAWNWSLLLRRILHEPGWEAGGQAVRNVWNNYLNDTLLKLDKKQIQDEFEQKANGLRLMDPPPAHPGMQGDVLSHRELERVMKGVILQYSDRLASTMP